MSAVFITDKGGAVTIIGPPASTVTMDGALVLLDGCMLSVSGTTDGTKVQIAPLVVSMPAVGISTTTVEGKPPICESDTVEGDAVAIDTGTVPPTPSTIHVTVSVANPGTTTISAS